MVSIKAQAKRRPDSLRRPSLFAFVFLCLATIVNAQPLAELQYRLTGLALEVFPTSLTVPRGVATQLTTTVPVAETLPAGAAISATLRGPSFPGTIEITGGTFSLAAPLAVGCRGPAWLVVQPGAVVSVDGLHVCECPVRWG